MEIVFIAKNFDKEIFEMPGAINLSEEYFLNFESLEECIDYVKYFNKYESKVAEFHVIKIINAKTNEIYFERND